MGVSNQALIFEYFRLVSFGEKEKARALLAKIRVSDPTFLVKTLTPDQIFNKYYSPVPTPVIEETEIKVYDFESGTF